MKRFKRATAILIALAMLVGVTTVAAAKQDDLRTPVSVQDFAEICD